MTVGGRLRWQERMGGRGWYPAITYKIAEGNVVVPSGLVLFVVSFAYVWP